MNPTGLRIAVFQGMVRPSRSPGWSATFTNPGTKLYPCRAMARQKTAFDGKPGKRPYLSALPFVGARQVSDCSHASQTNIKLEVFCEKQNPGFGGARSRTAIVGFIGFIHLCFGPGAQISALHRPAQRLRTLAYDCQGEPI